MSFAKMRCHDVRSFHITLRQDAKIMPQSSEVWSNRPPEMKSSISMYIMYICLSPLSSWCWEPMLVFCHLFFGRGTLQNWQRPAVPWGLLKDFAFQLNGWLGGVDALVAIMLGFASAVVDNVPLVAAAQGMYDLDAHPVTWILNPTRDLWGWVVCHTILMVLSSWGMRDCRSSTCFDRTSCTFRPE